MTEMNTATGFELMEKILPDVAEIMGDEDVKRLKEQIQADAEHGGAKNVFMPTMQLFLGKHREAMFRIAAALCGKTVEETMAQPMEETMEALQTRFSEDMIRFFALCLRMVMTA